MSEVAIFQQPQTARVGGEDSVHRAMNFHATNDKGNSAHISPNAPLLKLFVVNH